MLGIRFRRHTRGDLGNDGATCVWTSIGRLVRQFIEPGGVNGGANGGGFFSLALGLFSADGRRIMTTSDDEAARI